MKIILMILAILSFLAGFGIFSSANSAIHEIEAFVLFIVSAVLFSGSAIVSAINNVGEKLDYNIDRPTVSEESYVDNPADTDD